MALDERKGVWKSGKGKGRRTPKGRQLEDQAWDEVRALLGDRPRRRDLLIEHMRVTPPAWRSIVPSRTALSRPSTTLNCWSTPNRATISTQRNCTRQE